MKNVATAYGSLCELTKMVPTGTVCKVLAGASDYFDAVSKAEHTTSMLELEVAYRGMDMPAYHDMIADTLVPLL